MVCRPHVSVPRLAVGPSPPGRVFPVYVKAMELTSDVQRNSRSSPCDSALLRESSRVMLSAGLTISSGRLITLIHLQPASCGRAG